MRKSKMWRMLTVAAVAASMTCGIAGVQSVSADDKKTLKVAMECGYAPYNWTRMIPTVQCRFQEAPITHMDMML